MEFTVCGQTIEVTQDEIYGHHARVYFTERATLAVNSIAEKYKSYQNWDNFLKDGIGDGYRIIGEEAERVVGLLVQEGHYTMSSDLFAQKYGDVFLKPWSEMVDAIVELLESCQEMEEQARYARELRKAGRGQVVGGGFGVSGAVKGMAIAGAANLATGSLHGIANAIGNARTRNEIRKKQQELYLSDTFRDSVRDRIRISVMSLAPCFFKEMGIDTANIQPRDADTASAMMKNYPLIPEKDKLNVLLKALYLDPYNKDIYKHLLREFNDAEEVAQIGRLFGLGEEMDSIGVLELKDMVPEGQKLCKMSIEEKERLLYAYRDKKQKFGIELVPAAEQMLGREIIRDVLGAGWEVLEAEKLPEALKTIREKKEQLSITEKTDIEEKLSVKLEDALTVNGIRYSNLLEAGRIREQREAILHWCEGMEKKSYEELIELQQKVFQESKLPPLDCARDVMTRLEVAIRHKDEDRRTFDGKLFDTVELAVKARAIREEGEKTFSECDLDSDQEVAQAKEQLEHLNRKTPRGMVSDYLSQIKEEYKRHCTYMERVFSSPEERATVVSDHELLRHTYLENTDKTSEEAVEQARNRADKEADVHSTAKELFWLECNELIKGLKEDAERKKAKNSVQELIERTSKLDLNDMSRENWKQMRELKCELEKFDSEYTKEILPTVQAAVEKSEKLQKREKELPNLIENEPGPRTLLGVLIMGVIYFVVAVVIAVIALLLFSGWIEILGLIGALGYFGQNLFESFGAYLTRKDRVKKYKAELKSIRKQLNR